MTLSFGVCSCRKLLEGVLILLKNTLKLGLLSSLQRDFEFANI